MRILQLVTATVILVFVLADNISHARSLTDKTKRSHASVSVPITFRVPTQSGILNLVLLQTHQNQKMSLREIQFYQSQTFFYSDNETPDFSETPASSKTENCSSNPPTGLAVVGTTLDSVAKFSEEKRGLKYPDFKGCNLQERLRAKTVFDYLRAGGVRSTTSPLFCERERFGNQGLDDLTAAIYGDGGGITFTCDATKISSYNARKPRSIVLGKEIFNFTLVKAKSALYHEILHGTTTLDEPETRSIVACCSDSATDSNSDCRLLKLYRTSQVFHRVPELENLVRAVIKSSLSIEEKDLIVGDLNEKRTKLCSGENLNARNLVEFVSGLTRICETKISNGACQLQVAAFNKTPKGEICALSNRPSANSQIRNISDIRAGSTAADPSAKPGQPAAVPQKIVVTPNQKSVSSSNEIKELDRSVYSRGAEDIGRRFVASAGIGVAHASVSSLPIHNADGSASTALIGMKDGNPLLDIGHGLAMTATLSEPFSGETAQPAQPDVKFYDVKTGIQIPESRVASFSAGQTSSNNLVPGPVNVKTVRSGEAGANATTSEPSSGASSGSGAGVSAFGASSSGLSVSNKSNSRAPSASSASDSSQPPAVTSSSLKRLFAKSENPAQVINEHIEDLRAASMMVRYQCVWYPQDFKGAPRERFSLDTLQGRKCASSGPSR